MLILLSIIICRGDVADVLLLNGIVPVSPTGDAVPYQCSVDDEHIKYSTAPTEFFSDHGGALAFAINNRNGRWITVDRETFFDDYLTPEFQHFVLAHECAHHELGHQDKNSAYAGSKNKKPSESAADCRAIEKLVTRGFRREQFDIIFDQVSDSSKTMGMLINVEENSRHKSANGRADDLKVCLERTVDIR